MTIMRWFFLMGCFGLAVRDLPAAEPTRLSQFLGTWRGTSTCINKEVAPACKDEIVVYEVRPSTTPGAATLSADKVVDGKRLPMGDLEFVYSEKDGCWQCELNTRVHAIWCLAIDGDDMTGSLRDVPHDVDVRKVQAKHDMRR